MSKKQKEKGKNIKPVMRLRTLVLIMIKFSKGVEIGVSITSGPISKSGIKGEKNK